MRGWTLNVYLISALVFVVGVLVQVFLAGMVVVATQIDWSAHRGLGHFVGLPALIMLIMAYVGKFPSQTKQWTWLLFGTFILQAEILLFLRGSVPALSALHPVLALVEFALGVMLIGKARAFNNSQRAIP